jgi:hypothetical protein
MSGTSGIEPCTVSWWYQVLRRFEHFEPIHLADTPSVKDLALIAVSNIHAYPEVRNRLRCPFEELQSVMRGD